ncbi:unnamed protein product [Coregonus sp. 'balchen']|nr:unnamed protein product [Coregonus sp. 'balchen']
MDLVERARRLQVERESLGSKMEAEKHVMRAQLRDLLEKHQGELRRAAEFHEAQLAEREQALRGQLQEELGRTPAALQSQTQAGSGGEAVAGETPPVDSPATVQRMNELEAQAKLKSEEASQSEAKFLKVKAWSKSRIRQLEDELRKSQSGSVGPDVTSLRSRITDLEEEREETLWKLEQYDEIKAKNDVLEAKLVVYEEQQRKMAADLEQVTKRAASQVRLQTPPAGTPNMHYNEEVPPTSRHAASESGSADDAQSQVLDWQEMVSEAVTTRDRAREEKATMALRMSHMEEEREALASRQQELEEELVQARGLTGLHRGGKKLGGTAHQHSLQEDFEFDGKQAFHQDPRSGGSESTTPMEEEGENMGGWWPEYTSPNTGGLRSVVEELELERNQLQEQILGLEDRCQDLEDRLQLQARIQSLQNESERLQGQLASLRSQQSRDAEKHQLLVTSLNEQLKGLSDTQECLETSLIEKENTLVKTSEKLELIDSLRDSLKEKEAKHKEVSDKLLQSEDNLTEVSTKCNTFEKQCSELKTAVADLTHKLSVLKEKTQKQEATIETLQNDLDQTNDELDKLNTTHLEERAKLIHDLQSCEREIDNLRDVLSDKDKEILALSGNMAEHAEQIMVLKQEIKLKEEDLALNNRMAELVEHLKDAETELSKAKEEKDSGTVEVEDLRKQVEEDKRTILELRGEIQKQNVGHRNHLLECETQISSLKEQVTVASQKLQESEGLVSQLREVSTSSETLKDQLQDKEQTYEKELKSVKEERNKLLAEVAKHNDDLKTLSKQLEKQTECQEQLKTEVQHKLETISSLEEKLRAIQEEAEVEQRKFNTELQARDSEKEKLAKDLQVKLENISNMKKLLKNMKTEKQQLQADLKEKADELKSQKQLVDELNKKCTAALDLNSSLNSQANGFREENQRLQQDVAGKEKSISEMTDERDSLRSKVSSFETQHSENGKLIEGLLKDKEELVIRANELNKVLEQNKQSISESLFEKTNECSLLTKTLEEKEEAVARLQAHIDSLNTQVEQFHQSMAEKEKSVTDQNSQIEAQQSQLLQLQETMSLLQEQETALKAGLTEKDTVLQQKSEECSSLQNKLGQQKKLLSKLQGETKSLKGQCSHLTQRLEEKEETFRQMTQDCENHKDELNKRNESLKSLSSQLGVMNESSAKLESENTELKTILENHGAENNKLREEMEQRQAELVGLHSHIQALSEQNQQLRAVYEIREKELAQQMQVASELDRRVNVTVEQNTNLSSQLKSMTEEKQKLQQELAVQSESISELTKEKNSLQDKLSNFEMQHLENCKIIKGLLKDKNDLSVAVEELNKVLEQDKQTVSESLLEKTNECSNLTKLLRGSEEALARSQEQVDSLNTQLDQLNNNMTEKEKAIRNQNSQLQAQQSELSQLQETLALLEEQGTALKSELTEKDTMLQQKAEEWSSLQNKLNQLQGETKSLEGQCSQLTQRLEEKEQTFRQMTQDCENHKDELNKRNESLKSLSSQLGVMNESSVKLESENTELKTILDNYAADGNKLRQQMEQRQAEVLDLRDNIQALNEQNVRLKAELKNSVTEASKTLEEISVLKAEISNRDSYVSNLTKQLTAACSDRDSIGLTLQQRDESLKQQEMFIKQLQAKSIEGEGQMTQDITELQTQAQSLQKSLQDKDVSLHEAEKRLSLLRKKFTLESEDFKTQLNSNVGNHETASGRSTTYVSELEDSTTQLRGQVDSLTSESSLLKETLKEKAQVILEAQSTSSAVSESLNSKLKAKDAECESLKEQLSHLKESVSKLNSSLSAQSSEMSRLQEALDERGTAVMDQSKALQELQRRADEAALFKTQFMESTELVSQLQGQIQELSTKSASLSQSAEENQSAFVNLQEKYAAHLEELQEARTMLSQRAEEMSSLNKALSNSNGAVQAAESTIEALRNESSLLRQDLQQIQTLNVDLSKQKEDALATHQRSTSTFTVEIERLKSQYLHVAAQVNALTENLEQRELSLHAINSQYTAQVKQAEHVVSEMQKLEDQNKKLREEIALSKQENQQRLDAAISERECLQQEVQKLIIERDEHGRSYSSQIQTMQEQLHFQKQQQSSSINEVMEKMVAEKERLQVEKINLKKAHAEIKEKMEELARQQQAVEMAEQQHQQEKQTMVDDHLVLQNQLGTLQATVEELKRALEAVVGEKESQSHTFISESKELIEDRDRMKGELENALTTIAQQSSELQILQNTWAETQQQLSEEKEQLKVELEKAQSHCVELQAEMESHKLHMESLQQEKESTFMVVEQLNDEVAMLDAQLKEARKGNEVLLQKIPGLQDKSSEQIGVIGKEEVQSLKISPEEHEMSLKERDDALLISQALATEKEELIAALEQQLQRQIHIHEVAMEKMRTEVDELQQRSREDASHAKDQDNQTKTALLTRKLQAALVSRKEILKENGSLKEHMQILSAKNEEIGTSSIVLEMSVAKLKQQKEDLESSVSSLSKEKEKLIAENDRIINDNHNLSAACESLKLTIENITQQKQAFSCQLESLKDSQTDELSEWKSKHTELKQEYESLLQAYENVSSEMDKMRQLLEGARRERQEALFKAHKSESERENLEKQVGEMEDENERIKEKMRKFTKAKQQKMEELEEENKRIRIDLLEFDDKQKATVEELTIKNNHLEAEIHSLVDSSEALRWNLTEMQLNNVSLAEELKEASSSLEKWHTESKACEQNMQLRLDDALVLNNSLTAQIESQKTELVAQQEINELMQKEKETLSERIKQMQNEHEAELGEKDDAISELQEMISRHSQETISLNEKVKILEDDKSILQEELENVQEISDKVKNENEYLEMVILKNSERIDELTEAVNVLQAQNTQLSSQLTASKEKATQVCQEEEEQQLRLVKEFEEKLKMFQRGNEGSKNIKKELQELLKEKHHEINQLQNDSIKYQELILDLERSLKASESAHEQVEKELKETTKRISCLEEERRHLEAELTTHKNLLNEAKKDLTNISSEKDKLVELVSEKNNQSECQVMERTKALQHVAEQQKSIYMEREVILQQHIEELLGSKEKENQVVLELKRKIDSQDLQMNTLKREADTNLAKLAALSSSPQGADAVKQWNDMFLNTLHEKDSQLLEQGFVITRFLEDIRVKEKEVTELQVTKSRLERALGDYTVAATAQQRQLFIMGASNRELNETVELLNQQLQELSEQVERLEQDKSALNRHLTGSVDSTSKMEFDLQQLENTLLDTESQLLLSQSHSDMLQVDFEKQKAISLHLKSLLQNKDAEISSLLSSRDGQMSGYLEQLQANHRAQVEGYEDRLTALYYEREKADKEFRRLESKVKTLQMKVDKSIQEKEQMAAQMETFRNSMVSLQTERERLMSEYRMSEARNQTGMQGKEGSAEGDLNATKGLKHEIRTLLHQMDDLNSENAMLRAQLIRYREDLNQVLSLKDSQLKELLKKQQDAIKNLENQKATAEKQNRKTLLELEREGEASDALKAENSKLKTRVTDLEANILALNKGMQETDKGKVIADLQQAVAAKALECNDLQQKLFAQKVAADDWKGSLQLLERETEKKLGEAEDKYNSELDAFEQEVELMRNESKTADQRVAEVARDLIQTEQLLTNARVQSTDLKSQNESLGKAMAALQNDRDLLIEDFKILRNRYDEELRETQGAMNKVERRLGDATSELATLTKERHILVQKLSALESKDAPSQLTSLVDELSVALSEKEGQLQRVSLENDTYSSKVLAFSRSMASLQDDRDRLMEELAEAKRTFESRQGLGPEAVDIANTGESNSHRSSGIQALQTGRDGLETRQRVDELQSALQQAQAFKLQTETEVSGYQAELAELR